MQNPISPKDWNCEKDQLIFRWGFIRDTTDEDRDEYGWTDDQILDTPKTEEQWKDAQLWLGENGWEMEEATEYDYWDDLCNDCKKKLEEFGIKKPNWKTKEEDSPASSQL